MVALDEFWPKSVGAIRSITMEVVTAVFALTSLSSLLIAFRVSVVCTSHSASELWQFMVSVSAAPAILIGLIIAARMRQSLTGLKITHEELVSLAMIDELTGLLNRPGFGAVAAAAFEETRHSGQPVSALVCDIDAFRRSMIGTGTTLETALSETSPRCSKRRADAAPQFSADRAEMSL
jgi:predicted signal transduction protein with EAL and GGDEF domain